MFDIGFWELILVVLVALFVLGPERLPSALRAGQRKLGQLRAFGQKMQAELQHELRVKDLHENLKKIEAANYENLTPDLERALKELQDAAAKVNQPYADTSSKSVSEDESLNIETTETVHPQTNRVTKATESASNEQS